MSSLIGIVNLTRDSFSDGGAFLDPGAAHDHALRLLAAGADVVDLGAESTHPDAEDVPAQEEIRRLGPVVERLVAAGHPVSVDTTKPPVMRHVLDLGVAYVNDVTALSDPEAVEAVRDSEVRLILMHSMAGRARARKERSGGGSVVERILGFFEERIATLERAGIDRGRLILDPGMGFFLSSDPGPSLEVLRHLRRLRSLGPPVCISASRKSFIGSVLDRPVAERGPGTLATELHAWRSGVDFIRTHDVRSLADAIRMQRAIDGGEPGSVGTDPDDSATYTAGA